MVRAGVVTIAPQVASGELSAPSIPNVRINVNSATALAGGISYMYTDHWSFDIPLALPFKHHIKGAGAIGGSGEIATTKVLPATLFGQYRFREPDAKWRPYVGVGLTYADFYDEKGNGTLTAITNPGGPGTTMNIQDKVAPTVEVGVTVPISSRIFFEGMVSQTFLKTRSQLSTGQTIDERLNPVAVGLYIGWRF